MKTYLSRIFLALLLVFTIVGCSSSPDTLEEYIDNNPQIKDEIKNNNTSTEDYSLEIITKRNTLIYNFKFKQQLENESVELAKKAIKESNDELEEQMSTIAKMLEEKTNIQDINIEVNYLNADGTPVFKGVYKNK